eukprot:m.135361 g.135361  ORF g.135361 m.135361 type:complete len:403 (-) comp9950_c0_seq1:137-1345(-)
MEPRRVRKRDEKQKLDTTSFANDLISGINSSSSLEAVTAFLEEQGANLDYRTYSEQFFDIFVAGGILAPGGKLANEKLDSSKFCVFETDGSNEQVEQYATMLQKVVSRYRYLELLLEEEMEKLLKFIKAFETEDMVKFAKFSAFIIQKSVCSATVLEHLFIDSLTENTIAEEFIVEFFRAWLFSGSVSSLSSTFKSAELDYKMMELFPGNKRSFDYMLERFQLYEGLEDIVSWQLGLRSSSVKQTLVEDLITAISEGKDNDELIQMVSDVATPNKLKHSDVITLIFEALVRATNWNKKSDVMTEQALNLFNNNNKLILSYTGTKKSQVYLMNKLQEYCYDSIQPLMKVFTKLILLMYKLRILGEEAITQWFHEKHSSKGKSVFLEQMEPMIDWLATATEEEE